MPAFKQFAANLAVLFILAAKVHPLGLAHVDRAASLACHGCRLPGLEHAGQRQPSPSIPIHATRVDSGVVVGKLITAIMLPAGREICPQGLCALHMHPPNIMAPEAPPSGAIW